MPVTKDCSTRYLPRKILSKYSDSHGSTAKLRGNLAERLERDKAAVAPVHGAILPRR